MTTATVNVAALTRRIARVVAAERAHLDSQRTGQDREVEIEINRAYKSLGDYFLEKRIT